MDQQEVAKRVDRALKNMIADLIVANTELTVRVDLLMAEKAAEKETKKSPSLKAVQD